MLLESGTIGLAGLILSWLVFLPLLLQAFITAPWHKLIAHKMSGVWLGLSVALMVLWRISAGIHPGLELHLLGITLLNLLFGWQLALLGASITLFGVSLSEASGLSHFAVNAVGVIVVPLTVSSVIFYLTDKKLPDNFFIYVFINGFFAAIFSMFAAIFTIFIILSVSGAYSHEVLVNDFLLFTLMLMFPEGFFNGFNIALAVVYKPHWVWSFDDRRYIEGK